MCVCVCMSVLVNECVSRGERLLLLLIRWRGGGIKTRVRRNKDTEAQQNAARQRGLGSHSDKQEIGRKEVKTYYKHTHTNK